MKWTVSGASRDSGEDVDLVVEAGSAAEAANKARQMGIFVSSARPQSTQSAVATVSLLPSDNDLAAIAAAAQTSRQVIPYAGPRREPAVRPAPPPPPAVAMPAETAFLQTGHVYVSNARIIIFGKTYAVANITSVQMWTFPADRAWGFVLLGMGALFGLIGLYSDPEPGAAVAVWLLAVVCGGGGLLVCLLAKPRYGVRLASASGEVDVLADQNLAWIQQVIHAVNQAIVSRR